MRVFSQTKAKQESGSEGQEKVAMANVSGEME
jgi:hypothetical protein